MSNQQITTIKKVGNTLATMTEKIGLSLPQAIPTEKFMRIAQTAIQDPYLSKLINDEKVQLSSLYDAVSKCAQDGLVLDKREAALVPFYDGKVGKNLVQYMPMVSGIMKKMFNTGEIESISAHCVYEKDAFTYELGDNEHIYHVPCDDDDPGPIKRVYAIAKLKGGGIQRCVMSRRQVMKHKALAKTDKVWKQWEEEQWEKTAIKKLAKRLPQSSELDRVFQSDNATLDLDKADVEDGDFIDLNTGEASPPNKTAKKTVKKTASKKTTKAASKIKEQTELVDGNEQTIINGESKTLDDGFPDDQDGDPGYDNGDQGGDII